MRPIEQKRQNEGNSWARYFLWSTLDGHLVESSLLYMHGRELPYVVCLPSAVGCRMGCRFCAMPRVASPRPLSHEYLWELLQYSLNEIPSGQEFQVTFMGQGEPFENLANLTVFCSRIDKTYPTAMIGISTVGIAEGIEALSDFSWSNKVKLQLSLHALPPSKRAMIIPAENFHPILLAIEAARGFVERTSTKCCLNYLLINKLNDSQDDALLVSELMNKGGFYLKVSRLNPTSHTLIERTPLSQEHIFCETIRARGREVHLFESLGAGIGAGCGQTGLCTSQDRGSDLCLLAEGPRRQIR